MEHGSRMVDIGWWLDDLWKCASGFLIGPQLVLTCAHGMPKPGHKEHVKLRILIEKQTALEVSGAVRWHCYEGEDRGVDAALIEIVDPGWSPPKDFMPVRWGKLEGEQPGIEVEAIGFPISVETAGQRRELEQLRGTVEPLTSSRSGRFAINVTTARPGRHEGLQSGWQGISGAPVFGYGAARDLLLGLVVVDPPAFEGRRVLAVPSAAICEIPDAASLLSQYGIPLALYPVSAEGAASTQKTDPIYLEVDAIPWFWKSVEGPAVLRCTKRFRLDSLVNLALGPVSVVVAADQTPDTLTNTLNGLRYNMGSRHGPIQLRSWFQLDGFVLGSLGNTGALRNRLTQTIEWDVALSDERDGGRVGIVIPVNVDGAPNQQDLSGEVRSTLNRLRTLLPGAALLIYVHSEKRFDAMCTVSILTAALELDGGKPRGFVLRSTCHENERQVQRRSAGDPLATLVAALADELGQRELRWPLPIVEGAVGLRGLPAVEDVIDDLANQQLPLAQERQLLRHIRDLLPDQWTGLVRTHARRRQAPQVYTSLAVAAERSADLNVWLDAAGAPENWPNPAQVPAELMERNLTEAVLIELIAREAPVRTVKAWVELGVGQPSRVLQSLLKLDGNKFRLDLGDISWVDQDSSDLVAQVVVRCGLGALDLPDGASRYPLYWAVLARGGLDGQVLNALGRLPLHLLAVVDRRKPLTDVELIDTVVRLRRQIPHLDIKDW